jgi:hypothetical protein
MIFSDPSSGSCQGSASTGGMSDDFDDGISFTCTVTTANGCSSSTCINTQHINQDSFHEDVFEAIEDRLDQNTTCSSEEPGEAATSFQNAFGNASGDPDLALNPVGLDGEEDPNHVYIQNDCYNNPRIVVLPIVSSGVNGVSGDNHRPEPVRGFAAVYITGCYHEDDVTNSTAEKETNECNGNWNMGDCDDEDDAEPDCFWEIRGIPIHILVAGESLGGIAPPSTNAPLTIQTVQ